MSRLVFCPVVDWFHDWPMACASLYEVVEAIRYKSTVNYLSPCRQRGVIATGNPLRKIIYQHFDYASIQKISVNRFSLSFLSISSLYYPFVCLRDVIALAWNL